MTRKEELLKKIASEEARIGVVCLVYVGLPLEVAFAEQGQLIVHTRNVLAGLVECIF